MPQKLNKAGQMQDYIPKGNGDASGEYGTSNGTNKNFTTSDKKKTQANVITENKSVVVENEKAKKERIRKESNEKIQELHKISDRIIDNPTKEDKELFDKKMDEYEKWEKENSEKTIDYREYFKDKIAGKYAKQESNVENGFSPDEWEEIYKFSKEINKKNDDLIDETYEIAEKYNLNNKDAIKKLKEKYSDNSNKANIIDNDLSGKGNSIQEAYNLLNSDNIESIEYEINWKNTSSGRDNLTFNKKLDDKNKFLNMLDATYGSKKQLEKNLAFSHQTNYLILKVKEKGHRAKEVKLSYEDLIKLNNKITGKRTKQ